MDTITINKIDCYGKLRIGNSVEVIPHNGESFLVDNANFKTWDAFIAWAQRELPGVRIAELVADN